MNLLLDTCALLALATGDLPPAASTALVDAHYAHISAIVPWELAIKVKTGKLQLPEPALLWVQALAAKHQLDLPISSLEAKLLCAAANLPLIHRDPFDRVLIATALERNLTLLTADRIISDYPGINVIWN